MRKREAFTDGEREAVRQSMDQMTASTPPHAGSWWLAFMGLVLAIAGAIFVGVLWTAWQRAEETRRWTPTPAQVISSQVIPEQENASSPTKYRPVVRYKYTAGGKEFVSDRIRRVNGPKGNPDDAEAIREQFTPGQAVTCYVRPDDPTFAILQHSTRAALYTLWFPLLFVVGGLRMAWGAVKAMRREGQ